MIVITKSDVVWNYLGFFFRVGANGLLLPIILYRIPSEQVGIWYVFLALASFLALLDFGFAPTISRNISYAFCGAKNLMASGLTDCECTPESNYVLLKTILGAAGKLYSMVALLAILLLSTLGTIYIYYVSQHLELASILPAWIIFCIALGFNLRVSYWASVLTGVGRITESKKADVVAQGAYLIVAAVGVWFTSFGLLSLAIAYLVNGLLLFNLSKVYFYKAVPLKRMEIATEVGNDTETLSLMFYNARLLGVTSIGAFLVRGSGALICSLFFGLTEVASYSISLQLFSFVEQVAAIYFNTFFPKLSLHSLKKANAKVARIAGRGIFVAWITFIFGSALIIFGAPWFLALTHSQTKLLPFALLVFMAGYLLLELNHELFAKVIMVYNEIPFALPSIISGLFVVAISLLFALFTNLGVLGLMLAQAMVQLAYQNWKWPLLSMEYMNTTFADFVKRGVRRSG